MEFMSIQMKSFQIVVNDLIVCSNLIEKRNDKIVEKYRLLLNLLQLQEHYYSKFNY